MADVPSSADSESATDTAPCVGCGLCCDGTIYDKAQAAPGEKARLTSAGLTCFTEGGEAFFAHPCRFSSEGICTIYQERRFAICSSFRCNLLREYQAGRVSKADALTKVRNALKLRRAVTDASPESGLWSERVKVRAQLLATNRQPRLLLDIMALDYYLDAWFRTPNAAGAIDRDSTVRATGDIWQSTGAKIRI